MRILKRVLVMNSINQRNGNEKKKVVTNYQKIYGGFCWRLLFQMYVCVFLFSFGRNKINFIESDAIRPKTKSFRFKTISRLKLVLLLLFFSLFCFLFATFFCSYFIFFSLSLDTLCVVSIRCSMQRQTHMLLPQCIFESSYFDRICVEIAFAIDWATCHLNISKRND